MFLYRCSWFPEDESSWLSWSPDLFSSATAWKTFLAFTGISRYLLDCLEIKYSCSLFLQDKSYWLWWFPNFSCNAISCSSFYMLCYVSTFTGLTGTKVWTNINDTQRIIPTEFDHPLSFKVLCEMALQLWDCQSYI